MNVKNILLSFILLLISVSSVSAQISSMDITGYAGYQVTAPTPNTVTDVSGSWKVANSYTPLDFLDCSQWVGIQDTDATGILQIGTITQTGYDGTVDTYCFWENDLVESHVLDYPVVSPGDRIYANVYRMGNGSIRMNIQDLTNGQYVTFYVSGNGMSRDQAEWVLEQSACMNGLVNFQTALFGSYSGAIQKNMCTVAGKSYTINGANLAGMEVTRMNMTNGDGTEILATTTGLASDGSGFKVNFVQTGYIPSGDSVNDDVLL